MRIKSFDIKNFRSLYELHIDEFDKTTIFYGDNNAGKSNILNALYYIFKRKILYANDGSKQIKNFYNGYIENFANNFYLNTKQEITFTVEFDFEKTNFRSAKSNVNKLIKNTGLNNILFQGVIKRSDLGIDTAEIILLLSSLNGTKIFEVTPKNNDIIYFPTLDKGKKDQGTFQTIFSNLVEPFNDCVTIIESARDMLPIEFNNDLKVEQVTSSNFKKYLHSLYLSQNDHSIFEEINNIFNSEPFKFGVISFAKIDKELEIMIKQNDIRLPIKHIGSGLLQALYIISRVMYLKGKIICVEELEQNLSPKRQIEILKILQSMIDGGLINQLIISSHSSVYSKPKLGTIYYLNNKDGKTNIEEKYQKVMKKGLRDYFLPASLPPKTYTKEEWEEQFKIVKDLTEKRFRA